MNDLEVNSLISKSFFSFALARNADLYVYGLFRTFVETNICSMIIANPIYDVVFKKMMENERVAKFFISTLLEQQIENIEVKPQEFTYIKDLDIEDPLIEKYIKEKVRERLSINVFRLDFVATIKTESGEYKKVLI